MASAVQSEPAAPRRRRFGERVRLSLRILAHDDFAISYARSDGLRYAASLANRLQERGYSVCTDLFDTRVSAGTPPELLARVAESRVLVVIASPGAAVSEGVEEEIRIFGLGRKILIIDVDQASQGARWRDLVPGLPPTTESASALVAGEPSPANLRVIENAFRYTRRNARIRRASTGAVCLLLIAGLLLAEFGRRTTIAVRTRERALQDASWAQNERVRAVEARDAARTDAASAEREADHQRQLAATAGAEVTRLDRIAAARNLSNAAERLGALGPAWIERSALVALSSYLLDPSLPADTIIRHALALLPERSGSAQNTGKLSQETTNASGDDQCRKRFEAHPTHDGRYCVFSDGLVDASSGERFSFGTENTARGAVSSGRRFAVVGFNLLVSPEPATVFDLQARRRIARLGTDRRAVDMAFSPDESLVAVASIDGAVRVYRSETGERVGGIRHDSMAAFVDFTPDGLHVLSGGYDGTGRMFYAFNGDSGQEVLRLVTGGAVTNVRYVPERGQIEASGDRFQSVFRAPARQVLPVRASQLAAVSVAEKLLKERGAPSADMVVRAPPNLAMSATGEWLSMVADGEFQIYHTRTGNVRRVRSQEPIESLLRTVDPAVAAFVTHDRMLHRVEAETGRELAPAGPVSREVLLVSRQYAIVLENGVREDVVRLMDLANAGNAIALAHGFSIAGFRSLFGRSSVPTVAIDSAEQTVAALVQNPTRRFWVLQLFDTRTGALRESTDLPGFEDAALNFSPDGKLLSIAQNGIVLARPRHDGTARTIENLKNVRITAFSPDSRWFAAADSAAAVSAAAVHVYDLRMAASTSALPEVARIPLSMPALALAFTSETELLVAAPESPPDGRVELTRHSLDPQVLRARLCKSLDVRLRPAEWAAIGIDAKQITACK